MYNAKNKAWHFSCFTARVINVTMKVKFPNMM